MRHHKKTPRKGEDDMDLDQKKGFSPVVTISTLLFVTIITVFTYNSWFDAYVQNQINNVEEKTKLPVVIDSLTDGNLYLNNPNNDDVEINSVSIDKVLCDINETLQKGFNVIDITHCGFSLPNKGYNIVVESNIGFESKHLYVKGLDLDESSFENESGENSSEENETEEDIFSIGGSNGCEKLQNMTNNLSGDYYLTEDIYCYNLTSWNGGEGFIPIGDVSNPFTGTFDGGNYSIYYLYINSSSKETSLFGRAMGAIIKDVSLVGEFVEGEDKSVGGIAGYAQNTWINNVHISGNMTANKKSGGGIAGHLVDSNITRSSFTDGNVYGDRKSIGGLVGEANNVIIDESYSTGNVIGNKKYVGGLVGEQRDSTIIDSYAAGYVSSTQQNGGLIGNSAGVWSVTDSYWDLNITTIGVSDGGSGKTTVEMQTVSTFSTWDTNVWNINNGQYPTLK